MSNLNLIAPWAEHLSVTVLNSANAPTIMDFNRLRYQGVPETAVIKAGTATLVNRDAWAIRLHAVISQAEALANATKYELFRITCQYLRHCDQYQLNAFNQDSVKHQLRFWNERQRRGEIKDSTETTCRSNLSKTLQLLELPAKDWLPIIPTSGVSQQEPTQGYSQGDLKQLLPLIRAIFKQCCGQFLDNPELHRQTYCNQVTMSFVWQGDIYPVRSGIPKLFSAATYLLGYYTFSNNQQLFNFKRPKNASYSLSETDNWYMMSVFKRRSFKTVTVQIGANDLHIPSYGLTFFNLLLEASRQLNQNSDSLLLGTVNNRKQVVPLNNHCLNSFCCWLDQFLLPDDQGHRLRPSLRRFRATGSLLMQAAGQGVIKTATVLGNTPQVIKQHYSEGNQHENNQMLRDASQTIEQSARYQQDMDTAKAAVCEAQAVEVLTYEAYLKKVTPPQRNAHGSYCSKPWSQKAKDWVAKAQQRNIPLGERLACADLLACFSCSHQVLVEDEMSLWALLSFRECIEYSAYQTPLNTNFGTILLNIDQRLSQINPKALKLAEQKLAQEGRHPFWEDAQSLNSLLETQYADSEIID